MKSRLYTTRLLLNIKFPTMKNRNVAKSISIEEFKKQLAIGREEHITKYNNSYKNLPSLEDIKEHYDVIPYKDNYFLVDKTTGDYLHTFKKRVLTHKNKEFACYRIEGYILPTSIDMFIKIINSNQHANQDKFAIVSEDFTDFYKSEGVVVLMNTLDEAEDTLGMGEWDKAYVVQIKSQYLDTH